MTGVTHIPDLAENIVSQIMSNLYAIHGLRHTVGGLEQFYNAVVYTYPVT